MGRRTEDAATELKETQAAVRRILELWDDGQPALAHQQLVELTQGWSVRPLPDWLLVEDG